MDSEQISYLRNIQIEEAVLHLGHFGLQMLCILAGTDPTTRKKFSDLIDADWQKIHAHVIECGKGDLELLELDLIEADLTGRYPIKLNERGRAVMADWIDFEDSQRLRYGC